MHFNTEFPSLLKELSAIAFSDSDDDGPGIEFEFYSEFNPADDSASWIKAWTGNQKPDAHEFRIFGQDGSGGMAAFWLVVPDRFVLDQPIVFLGSEGQHDVIAKDFADFLWLLAGGIGPMEAVLFPNFNGRFSTRHSEFAALHAPDRQKTPSEVLTLARESYGEFKQHMKEMCK